MIQKTGDIKEGTPCEACGKPGCPCGKHAECGCRDQKQAAPQEQTFTETVTATEEALS